MTDREAQVEKIKDVTELLCCAVYAWDDNQITDSEFLLYEEEVAQQIDALYPKLPDKPPPVLTDEEIDKAWPDRPLHADIEAEVLRCAKLIAKAQYNSIMEKLGLEWRA